MSRVTERRVKALEEAVRFYAAQTHGSRYPGEDAGRRAREALAVDAWDSSPVGHAYPWDQGVLFNNEVPSVDECGQPVGAND